MSGNIIQLNEKFIQNELKTLVKNSVEETLNALLDAEADKLVQAERYARDEARKGYRAGHYDRSFTTQAGEVNLKVPKLKGVNALSRKHLLKCTWLAFPCVVLKALLRSSGVKKCLLAPLVTSTKSASRKLKNGALGNSQKDIRMSLWMVFFSSAAGAVPLKMPPCS